MNDLKLIKQCFNIYIKCLKRTENVEKAFTLFYNKVLYRYKDYFYVEDAKTFLNRFSITISKKMHSKKQIIRNTLSFYPCTYCLSDIKFFYKLIPKDSIVKHKDVYVFSNLFIYLRILFSHKESIKKLNELENEPIHLRGIAKTSHPTVNESLKPRIKQVGENYIYNPSYYNKVQKNVYDEFKKNPKDIIAMYAIMILLNIRIKNNKEIQECIMNQSTFLNSSTKLNDSHIFKSLQIRTLHFYISTNLSEKKYIRLANAFLESFFDEIYISKLNIKDFKRDWDIKTIFNDTIIYNFQSQCKK